MKTPIVSVVIPTFNRAPFLFAALESVRQQTLRDVAIIVVDDGSTDGTEGGVQRFGLDITYRRIEHSGRSIARNIGLELVRSPFIAFLDSDDLFRPTKLERQLAAMQQQPSYAMCYTAADVIDDRGQSTGRRYEAPASGDIYKQVAFYLPVTILLPTVMIRTAALRAVGGFDPSLNRFEDTDLWRRVAKRFSILALPEPLTAVRTHRGNQMENPQSVFRDLTAYVRKVSIEDRDRSRAFLRRGAAMLYATYGVAVYQQTATRWQAWRFFTAALRTWPTIIGLGLRHGPAFLFYLHAPGLARRIHRWRHRRQSLVEGPTPSVHRSKLP